MKSATVVLLLLQQFICLTNAAVTIPPRLQRVAEGELTTLGEYPFVLSLGLTSWANIYHLHECAGSILTESWVITSARCVEDVVDDVGRYYWLAGTNNLRQEGAQHSISRIIIHPDYDRENSLIHDIALVKVKNPFEFSTTIQPIEISTIHSVGTAGVVVGWGQVSLTLIQPDVLRGADVVIIDVDVCRDVYAPWNLTIQDEYQFCAVTDTLDVAIIEAGIETAKNDQDDRLLLERSACRGDQGGGFFLRNTEFPFFIGFVSWTYECNPSGYPAVYTKVSAYLDWISENTGYWI